MSSWFEDDLGFIQIEIPNTDTSRKVDLIEDEEFWITIDLGLKTSPLDEDDHGVTNNTADIPC